MSPREPSITDYQLAGAAVRQSSLYDRAGGRTDYVVTGSRTTVSAAIAAIKDGYHPAGYGTWFNWPPPPDGPKIYGTDKPNPNDAPREIAPDVWEARGSRSNSCD